MVSLLWVPQQHSFSRSDQNTHLYNIINFFSRKLQKSSLWIHIPTMSYLGIVSRRKYFGISERGRRERGQWRKEASQSAKHINDRQKHFYGKAQLTAEGALTLCSVWMLTASYNCVVYSLEIVSILSRKEYGCLILPSSYPKWAQITKY